MKKLFVLSVFMGLFLTCIFGQKNSSPVTRIIKKEKKNVYIVDVSIQMSKIESIDTKSFARLSENIPEDCTCTIIEAARSDAQIKGNNIKFIWLQMPSGDFHVKYELRFDKAPEEIETDGIFSYMLKNGGKSKVEVETIE